ncbi:MAG TPA: DUF2062 domain-containing protein [Myxococcota bacterium]|nr:DUF2062 domain-containing protein [Myxococcota bacterium]
MVELMKGRSGIALLLLRRGSPRQVAAGVALGVGLSCVPVPMFGLLAPVVAPFLRLQAVAAGVGTVLVNPLTYPFIYGGELWLGAQLVGQPLPGLRALVHMSAPQLAQVATDAIVPLAIGTACVMPALGLLTYGASLAVAWGCRRNAASRWQESA